MILYLALATALALIGSFAHYAYAASDLRLQLLGRHTWRWALLRHPLQYDRVANHTANGIEWYARFTFLTITHFSRCYCPKGAP